MADSDAASVKQVQKSREQKDYDPRLDFFSDRFDPLLALTTPGVVPPDTTAPVYDNLDKYQSVQKSQGSSSKQQRVAPASTSSGIQKFERNWLPHQCKYMFLQISQLFNNLFLFKLAS